MAALTTSLVVLLAGAVRAVGPEAAPPTRPYVIAQGDTLWSLARSTVGPQGDPRPAVDLLRSLNAVDPGELQPGMTILLPAS